MSNPPGTYGACFVPKQTGYPPASQPANRATQAVLAYQAFQQSVAEQPQYIRFVGTPEDIALLRQELERGRPVRFIQQMQGGPSGPLVEEIEGTRQFAPPLPMISDAGAFPGYGPTTSETVIEQASMLTVDKRKAQVRNELNLQADYGNSIGCNIREAEGNLCKLGFILRGSSHSLLFELPDDYSKIQCENAWASVVYYTYCAGVIGKLPQYANGRKLLEAIEGRLKSEPKPHEARINAALVSNAGDPLFGGPDGYVPYEAAKVVKQPSFFGAEEAYADPTEPTWQDDHKREKLD